MFPIEKKETKTVLTLLGYELFQRELEVNILAADWTAVLAEGDKHAVTALLYPGMRQLNGVPEDALAKARSAAITATIASESMLKSQRDILDLLEAKHIPCVVLKGTSVACFYPHPELRVPGDIDILVDAENLIAACNTLKDNDYTISTVVEKHTCLQKREIYVEMHQMVTIFPDSEKGRFAREFMTKALRNTQTSEIEEIHFPVLSDIYKIIALLAHMEHHLATSGIGLRQLCDWAVTVNAMRDVFSEENLSVLEECGLLWFAKIVTRLCERYLGLGSCIWSQDASEELVDALIEDILDGGNFHSQYQKRTFAGLMMDAYDIEGTGKKSILRSYTLYLRQRLRWQYPWAKSRLWIPIFAVFYPLRWGIRVLLGKRKKVNLAQAACTAREREKLLRGMKLYR